MKWFVLLGFVLTTVAVGAARFGGWLRAAPVWLDVLFILGAAGTVGTLIWIIIASLRGAAEDELDASQLPPPRIHATRRGR